MAAGQGPREGGRAAAPSLRSLAEGLRVVTVLLTPYIPESAEKLLDALGAPDDRARRRALRRPPRRADREQARAPLPQAGVIDSHTHLDRGPAPEAELVAQAARRGRHADPHDRDGRARHAEPRCRRGDLRRGLRRDRPPPERGDRLHGRDHRRAQRARPAPEVPGDRRDRPRRLPRLRAPRRTRNAPSTPRSSSRTSWRSR